MMARRRSYAVKKRSASLPYRGKKGASLLSIFKIGGTTHRRRASQGGGTHGLIRDQTGLNWWGKKRGR